jgi:MFS family permease
MRESGFRSRKSGNDFPFAREAIVTERRDARAALAILTFINLLNYIDRYIAIAAMEPIKRDFGFSDAEVALVTVAAFMISYSITSPLFGRLGDL